MKEVVQRKRKLVYFSIPIKDNPTHKESLNLYRNILLINGYAVADPTIIAEKYLKRFPELLKIDEQERENKIMLQCLKVLSHCDFITFIKSSIESIGVKIEYYFAKRSGISELKINILKKKYSIKNLMKVRNIEIITEIFRKICEEINANYEDIFISKSRYSYYTRVRWIAMYYLRQNGYTLNEIGKIMNLNHTVIIYGIKRYLYETQHYKDIYNVFILSNFKKLFQEKIKGVK